MKKSATIFVMIFCFARLTGEAQENKKENIQKKQQFCSAKIILLNNSIEKYALGGFAQDSLIVFPVQMPNGYPQIQIEKETRIAATSIKKIGVSIKKVRNSPPIYSYDSDKQQDANASIVSTFKKNRTKEVFNNTGEMFSGSDFSNPFAFVLGVGLLPVLLPTFILLSKEKTYRINGKPKKLDRMKEKLIRR